MRLALLVYAVAPAQAVLSPLGNVLAKRARVHVLAERAENQTADGDGNANRDGNQDGVKSACTSSTSERVSTLSLVVPSPGASVIPITTQSQVVTSFVPYYTLCPQQSSGTVMSVKSATLEPASPTPAVLTVGPAGSWLAGDCSTSYSPTVTTICYTTLAGLGTVLTVTECAQNVTFSTDKTFTLEQTPSRVNLVTTNFVAGWQQLTDGAVPSNVMVEVCSYVNNDTMQSCYSTEEYWTTTSKTLTTSWPLRVTISETLNAPSSLLIGSLGTSIGPLAIMVIVDTVIELNRTYTVMSVDQNASRPTSAPSLSESDTTIIRTTTVQRTRTVTRTRPATTIAIVSEEHAPYDTVNGDAADGQTNNQILHESGDEPKGGENFDDKLVGGDTIAPDGSRAASSDLIGSQSGDSSSGVELATSIAQTSGTQGILVSSANFMMDPDRSISSKCSDETAIAQSSILVNASSYSVSDMALAETSSLVTTQGLTSVSMGLSLSASELEGSVSESLIFKTGDGYIASLTTVTDSSPASETEIET